jgi:hypothetical protein
MVHSGKSFYTFLTKEAAFEVFRLQNTQCIGGLFAVLNTVWKGHFKGLPVVDIRHALVPWKIIDQSLLHTYLFKKEENVRKQVCHQTEMGICNFTSVNFTSSEFQLVLDVIIKIFMNNVNQTFLISFKADSCHAGKQPKGILLSRNESCQILWTVVL